MTLQEKMLDYRARERISQKELANRCGLSLQTVCSVENGLQNPGKMTLRKILHPLELPCVHSASSDVTSLPAFDDIVKCL